MNEELHTLPPFIDFCVKILGYEPSVYDDYAKCFTYLECLTYTYTYLKNQIVPAVNSQNAVIEEMKDYMDHYFDNLDVQQEINNKLDTMAQDGTLTNLIANYIDPIAEDLNSEIQSFESEVSSTIQSFDSRLSALSSGAPTPVSSTADMTDTSKIYLLTTDGNWYYYDGETWTSGGTYQATSVNDGSIDILKLSSNLQNNFLKYYNLMENPTHYTNYYCGVNSSTQKLTINSNTSYCYDKYSLTAGNIYQVTGGINYSQVVGIIVADANDNIIYSTAPESAPNTHDTQSLFFRANSENLYLYISYEQSGTTSYQRLNFHQAYVLNNICLNDNFNFSPNELITYTDGYRNVTGTMSANSGSKAHVYNMQKGRKYVVTAENIYALAGLVLTDYSGMTIIYSSSSSNVGSTAQRFTYEFTANQDGLIFISTLSNSVNYSIAVEKNVVDTDLLLGKSISCDGDSIMKGSENDNTSYYNLIINKYNMILRTNNSVGGATIATGTQASGGVDRHWISSGVLNISTDSDYIIINGGINDYYNNVTLGTITDTFTDAIDSTTFAGGMELLCRNLLNRFINGQKILFVFNHNINATWYTKNTPSGGHTFEDYYDIQVAVLKKYGIPYLDLIHESQLNTILDTYKTTYTVGDGVHPNTAGYNKFYVDKISAKLKSL